MNLSELKIGEIGYIKNVNSCQGTDISRLIKIITKILILILITS